MHDRTMLAERYGLTDAQVEPLVSTGGAIKAVFRVMSEGRRYVWKRYRGDYRALADVAALHEVQVWLRQQGEPVAAAHPDRDGRLASPDDDSCWVLYDEVAGRHPQPGRIGAREAAVLGESLGRLDLCLSRWQTDWPGAEPLQIYPADEQMALFERLLRCAEQGTEPVDRVAEQSLRDRLRGLERLADLAPRLLSMERQWVHGDPNEGNTLLDGGRVAAYIDFDNMRRAPRGFDFMYSLGSCFPAGERERDDYARSYLAAVRPGVAELELYAPLWAYWLLCDVWPINWRYLEPQRYDPAWEIEPVSDWWERRLDATTDWLLKLNG